MSNTETLYSHRHTLITDIPSRSRLYPLPPLGVGTPLIESLTSYVNRLAWAYGINPRVLVAQEILPNLYTLQRMSADQMGKFSQMDAKTINGIGKTAVDWSAALERLTMQLGLQNLTLHPWASGFSYIGLLHKYPTWCPVCYHEWQENGLPIYQPLLWTLQIITVCPQHKRRLVKLCPYCQRSQSVILAKTRPGYCTRCNRWLGISLETIEENEINNEVFNWQQWIVNVIEQLRQTAISSGSLPWKELSEGIATCVKAYGGARRLAYNVGVSHVVFSRWEKLTDKPSFRRMLEFCYILKISPLHLMTNDLAALQGVVQGSKAHQQILPKSPSYIPVDRQRAFELVQLVLNDQGKTISVREIERRLGLRAMSLIYHFPQECALISARYRAYCNQRANRRISEMCDEVRQVTLTLWSQGTNPSLRKVAALLSHPSMMRTEEAKTTWHATRHELGLES